MQIAGQIHFRPVYPQLLQEFFQRAMRAGEAANVEEGTYKCLERWLDESWRSRDR
jgi:hypothetical protein